MLFDELFEAMKPSDVPTYMRRAAGKPDITMRDVEKERPQSAYRYRVIHPNRNESPKEFMDMGAAAAYAKQIGGRMERIVYEEQNLDEADFSFPDLSPRNRGAAFLEAIRNRMKTTEPVGLDFGTTKYYVSEPEDKKWFVDTYEAYRKKGGGEHFLINMGTEQGFMELVKMLQQAPLSTQQAGSKKKSSVAEAGSDQKSARTQRMMDKIRMRQPQATSDLEAIAYDLEDQQKRDREDIERLEREASDVEQSVKQDLEQTVKTLRQKKGVSSDALKQIQNRDRDQSAAINRILQVDREQSKAINDLERMQGRSPAAPEPAIRTVEPVQPSASSATPAASAPQVVQIGGRATTPDVAPLPVAQDKEIKYRKPRQIKLKPRSIKGMTQELPLSINPDELTPDSPSLSAGNTLHEGERGARVERILKMLRARYPHAKDDLEALLMSYRSDQAHDQHEIDRLDAENDQEEADIDTLEKVIKDIIKRPGIANESLWAMAGKTALIKFHTMEHPAFQTYMESWYRAHGGTIRG